FAEIAVDTYQDPSKRLFTYRVPEKLAETVSEGAKVIIPFGKRTVEGFIWSISNRRPPFPTKEIQAVKSQPFSKNQVEIAKWMAGRYLGTPLECLRCQIGEKGAKSTTAPPENIHTLLLVPTTAQVKIQALAEKQKDVLVGSRSAVFAQLPNLKRIIVEEPENWNYKDERAPYYHAAEVAKKRAELENLAIELRYQLPRAEDVKSGVEIPLLKPVKIVDLNREKLSGNFTFVSQPLESHIAARNNTIVYVNSRELREGVVEELRKIGADRNTVEIFGPEVFSMVGKGADYVFWADADTLLNLPDFRAHEKLVWTAVKLSRIAQKAVYLQTSFPQTPVFEELRGDIKRFYERELKNRRELGYPPFTTPIRLSYSAKSSAKASLGAEKLFSTLYSLFSDQVSPPYEPYSPAPGKHQLNMVVRTKPGDLDALAKIAKAVPPDWKTEVDPESLL
ncbi:MAG: hypothetical protein WED08_01155, partial [Patescibacteria group bacterium]